MKQRYDEFWKPKLIGINKATTLHCFCDHHDTKLFYKIDKPSYCFSDRNVFFISYRSLLREVYQKKQNLKLLALDKNYVSVGGNIDQYNEILRSEKHALKILETAYDEFKEVEVSGKYEKFNFKIFELPDSVKISCSGSIIIDTDIRGNSTSGYIESNKLGMLSVNILFNGGKSFFVLGWTQSANQDARFLIRSLEESSILAEEIIYFVFIHLENICMKPEWYNSLNEATKETLEYALIQGGMNFIPRAALFPLNRTLDLN